jgi:hypothetical protein
VATNSFLRAPRQPNLYLKIIDFIYVSLRRRVCGVLNKHLAKRLSCGFFSVPIVS